MILVEDIINQEAFYNLKDVDQLTGCLFFAVKPTFDKRLIGIILDCKKKIIFL